MKTFAELKAEWEAATAHLSRSAYLRELEKHGLKLKRKVCAPSIKAEIETPVDLAQIAYWLQAVESFVLTLPRVERRAVTLIEGGMMGLRPETQPILNQVANSNELALAA